MNLPENWYQAIVRFAKRETLDDWVLEVVDTFGPQSKKRKGPDIRGAEEALEEGMVGFLMDIQERLATEVDLEQAKMFRRRFTNVVNVLTDLGEKLPAARIFRLAMVGRAVDILADPAPAVHRIRALADFYYSQSAVMSHKEKHKDKLERLGSFKDAIEEKGEWRRVSPGIRHMRLRILLRNGPTSVNVLKIDPAAASFECVQVRSRTPESFEKFVENSGAVAGISGGFFLYSEDPIDPPSMRYDPVGLLVNNARVIQPPVFRRGAFLAMEDGKTHIQAQDMSGVEIVWHKKRLMVAGCNSKARALKGPTAYTRKYGPQAPEHKGPVLQFVGGLVRRAPDDARREIPLNGFVLLCPEGEMWDELANSLAEAGQVAYHLPKIRNARVKNGMAGGPILLEGGRLRIQKEDEDFVAGLPPVTFAEDETRDTNLLPRMAIGLTPRHEIVMMAVDGRHLDYALGMTLRQTAEAMRSLGCIDALNLDGGSSKRMVITGRMVDNPSTEVRVDAGVRTPIRPVQTAILVHALKETRNSK